MTKPDIQARIRHSGWLDKDTSGWEWKRIYMCKIRLIVVADASSTKHQ
jgi:hypothetical protein